jgi:hypothetical protein
MFRSTTIIREPVLTTIIREPVLSLAKVMLEHLCPYMLYKCSNITLARLSTSSLMTQSHSAQHTTHTPLPRHAATPTHNL